MSLHLKKKRLDTYMIVSIHQPHYLPWLGYFDKADSSDVFVLLDTVQYEKNGWQNRNKIKGASGWQWLTVPVRHSFGASIRETEIIDGNWGRKHLQAITTNYSKAPYFDDHSEFLRDIYSREWKTLSALTIGMFRYFADTIGLQSETVEASTLGDLPDEPNSRLAAIVGALGGDTYLAGAGFRGYYKKEPFEEAGIRVIIQDYTPAPYPQLYGEFIPGLAILDALFNSGDKTREVIREGRRTIL